MGYGALLGRVAMALAVTLFAGSAEAAAARTYVANCGNPSYLEFKPDRWSSSCAGGGAEPAHGAVALLRPAVSACHGTDGTALVRTRLVA